MMNWGKFIYFVYKILGTKVPVLPFGSRGFLGVIIWGNRVRCGLCCFFFFSSWLKTRRAYCDSRYVNFLIGDNNTLQNA